MTTACSHSATRTAADPCAVAVLFAMAAVLLGCGSAGSIAVVVAPAQPDVRLGETTAFTVSPGLSSTGVWRVAGSPGTGTISEEGLFQAPAIMPADNIVSVSYVTADATYVAQVTLWNPAPVITELSSTTLRTPSTSINVTGSGFIPTSTAVLNGTAVPTTYVDSSHLGVVVNLTGPGQTDLALAIENPAPGESSSVGVPLSDDLPPFTVSPSTLVGGDITVTLTGGNFDASSYVTLDGMRLNSTFANNTLIASGYLVPWKVGSTSVGVVTGGDTTHRQVIAIPIAATAVPYDVASRMVSQAGLGQRHDVIEHVQAIGLDAYITEQLTQPAPAYDPAGQPVHTIMDVAISGSALLRERVSAGLQSFVMNWGSVPPDEIIPWRMKMDQNAFGNYRQVLEDAADDVAMGDFLNLAGNQRTTDPNQTPNLNFARELLQLFSMGPSALNEDGSVRTDSAGNPIPNFDQTTIIGLSRALTGWWKPPPDNGPYNYWGADYALPLYALDWSHDSGQKVLFGNVILPADQTPAEDKRQALDAVFAQSSVPPFVSRILIQRLVTSAPSPAYVQRIARVFENDGTGTRGNMAALVRAILEDPEARAGDTAPSPTDGFLQDPWLWELSAMSVLGMTHIDDQPNYVLGSLGERLDAPPNVFGFFSPTYTIPGTTINSPEFQLLNNVSLVQRQEYTYSMVMGLTDGFWYTPDSYLRTHFLTVPDMVEALNHLLFHGQMSAAIQAAITSYCSSIQGQQSPAPLDVAIFLALNADSYQVSH